MRGRSGGICLTRKRLLQGSTIVLTGLSLWLSAELLFLNSSILPTLQRLLAAAYHGEAHPLVNLVFRRFATDAYKSPLGMYQDKLTYAYDAIKVPALVTLIGATVMLWLSTRPREAKLALRKWHHWLAYAVFLLLLAALLVHAQLGTYSRFMADDYCGAAAVAARGVFGGTVTSYLTWSGKYSSALFGGLALRLGPGLIPLHPAFILLAWFGATALALFQFPLAQGRLPRLCLSGLLSAALAFTTLQTSPHLNQTLYWFSAMSNVLPPLILSAASVGIARHRLTHDQPLGNSWVFGVGAGGLSFIAGGFNETYTVLQASAWALFLLVAIVFDGSRFRTKLLPRTAPFLLGSLAALAVVAAAPGNSARIAVVGVHPTLVSTMTIAWQSLFEFLVWSVSSRQPCLSLLALLFLSTLISAGFFGGSVDIVETRRLKRKTLLLLPVGTLILLYSCFVPAAYGLGGSLPGRDQVIPAFVLVCAVATGGLIIGQAPELAGCPARRQGLRPVFLSIAACTLILYFLTTTRAMYIQLRQLPRFALYASRWDANESLIREALAEGADRVVLVRIPENWAGMPDLEINNDPGHWVDICASQYYGIAVTAEGPSNE
jgi:hypothetical protein